MGEIFGKDLARDRLDRKLREVDLELKRLEVKEKNLQLDDWIKKKLLIQIHETEITKIHLLMMALSIAIINEDKTVFGSEPVYKNAFNEAEADRLKQKIFEMIKKI